MQGADRTELQSGLSEMEGVERYEVLEEGDGKTAFRLFPRENAVAPLERLIQFCAEKDCTLESFRVEEGRLDEVFRTITQSDIEEAAK